MKSTIGKLGAIGFALALGASAALAGVNKRAVPRQDTAAPAAKQQTSGMKSKRRHHRRHKRAAHTTMKSSKKTTRTS
jgi:hypothetical protein